MTPFLLPFLPVIVAVLLFPRLFYLCGKLLGWHLRSNTQSRRELLSARVNLERRKVEEQGRANTSLDEEWEKVDSSPSHAGSDKASQSKKDDWDGIVGFFHPFCNAGGGGERVLWAAIKATQEKWPNATCVVYTGDNNVKKEQMIKRAEDRFNIQLYSPTVMFLYLSTRDYVLASSWPHFTLLGQSIGSLILGYDAFSLLVPDILIDTMGYAFTLALSKFLFPDVPTGAYVHYPTISTDMLGSLDEEVSSGKGRNAGTGKGWRGRVKKYYWLLFARLYCWAGANVDIIMTNSSWTQGHIQQLWGSRRTKKQEGNPISVLYPPCAVSELEREIEVSPNSEASREPVIIYIAQFRPEKNHQLIITAFAKFLNNFKASNPSAKQPRLLLAGSVRDSTDETSIYSLRILAHELHITGSVTFLLNAPWPTILSHLRTASVGANAMWNEHFGIGVVEYQAAGLISVVNDSGGPKLDIVVDEGNGRTGFHASTEEEYTKAFGDAFALNEKEVIEMRQRARKSARRFDENVFAEKWLAQMEKLVALQVAVRRKKAPRTSS